LIVLDTHALLWMDRNDPMLGPQARALIENTWRSDVDRFIVATSYQLGATLMTADTQIPGWGGDVPRQNTTP
jgi:PIN domain nuclease of toxin-antitoxin system